MVSWVAGCDCVAEAAGGREAALRHGVRGHVRGGAGAQRQNARPRQKRSPQRRGYLFSLSV